MKKRWLMLVLLFSVRTVTGIQYQSVASVSTLLVDDLAIDYGRLGMLIGLYQLPGIFLAIPGGFLGRKFGDRRTVAFALGLMSVGGLVMGVGHVYPVTVLGRTLAGVGAVLLNVLLTKMVADWFDGQEIVTAMAILVSSWPLGISLGLISLGSIAQNTSWQTVMLLTAAVCAISLVLVASLYRDPADGSRAGKMDRLGSGLSRSQMWPVILAALIWSLFNAGFAIVPSFAPDFLATTGLEPVRAASLVSVTTWVVIPAVQLGGYLAERFGRPNLTLILSFSGIGLAIWLIPVVRDSLPLFLALGLLFGPPPGIILALPAEVLQPEQRAVGMGIFYTCYYAGMAALMPVAGLTRDLSHLSFAPLLFGGALLFLAIALLGLLRASARRFAGAAT